VPEVAFVPDHAPEAIQEVAFVEDQVRIEDPPLVIGVGLATSAAVTLPVLPVAVGSSSIPAPPQAENVRAATRTRSKVLARGMGVMTEQHKEI
jgi:hypothetical protein